jgi:hypothetical protein
MQDRVGSNVLTAEQLKAVQGHLTALSELLGPVTVNLSGEERLRTTKMRVDGDWVVSRIADLAAARNMSLPGISIAGIRGDLALAQQLGSLATDTTAFQQRIDDTVLEARSECWWGTLAYYTALVRMAGTDPALADALKPVVEYFSRGKRRKTEEQPK